MAKKKPVKPPAKAEVHMLTRMGNGFTPAGLKQLRKAGGPQAWFERQLMPTKVKEAKIAKKLPGWYPQLAWSPAKKWAEQNSGRFQNWWFSHSLSNLTLQRRVYSNRQVLEQMVDFWSNHLHVPSESPWEYRADYDNLIRKHALGRFDKLLVAATLHPAMLKYLDNYQSRRGFPNENHGRELLELHTVGRTAGYTEAMVKSSAVILSGWTLDEKARVRAYDPERHTVGRVKVLGFSDPNKSADGRAVTKAYLKYLARHPRTAERICRKLAERFVSDNPSNKLVRRMAKAYRQEKTDIKAPLRVMVASKEFKRSRGKKVRTPLDDLVATVRALQIVAQRPVIGDNSKSFGWNLGWMHGAGAVYNWPTPEGPPQDGETWSSISRLLKSMSFHGSLAGAWWPTQQVVYRKPAHFLPREGIRVDDLVDHLSRTWFGHPASKRMVQAVCQACGGPESWDRVTPSTVVDRDHALMGWKFQRMAAILLDSPTHMTR